jgi:high affinity sulfate transporter 1
MTAMQPDHSSSWMERWLPGIASIRRYRRAWLGRDVLAGLALVGILVPAGMAYAEASGLPPITGLYATIVPLFVYAVMGPSRLLILGPDSSLVPLILAALAPFALLGTEARVEHAALLAVMVGVLIGAIGLLRLGFIADIISMPVREGFLLGIAIIILVTQLPLLFGFTGSGDGAVQRFVEFVSSLLDGETNEAALAIGAASLIVILAARRIDKRIPGVLVAVIGATLVSWMLDLANRAGIVVVGELPQGLPSLTIPTIDVETIVALAPAAVSIVLVTAADTVVLSRTFAARHSYRTRPDREMIALGGANLATGLFSGYPISSSSSRTAVAESARQKTQLAAVVGALAIAAMLVLAPGLLAALPQSALAAVVISAAIGLIALPAWQRLWAWRRSEFLVGLVTLLGVLLIGVVEGILIAAMLSVLAFLRRAWRPHDAVLGRATGVKGYHDLTFYPDARRIPGLTMYRFDAALSFFNAEAFRERVLEIVSDPDEEARWLVVAAEPITDVDTTAAEQLGMLLDELEARSITFAFAQLKDPVKARLDRYGLVERIGRERFFPTMGTAVDAYVAATGSSWVDWEEQVEASEAQDEPATKPTTD